jgi:hypothetical protein
MRGIIQLYTQLTEYNSLGGLVCGLGDGMGGLFFINCDEITQFQEKQ